MVVDADQGTLTLLGCQAATLALHEALRQHAAASERLEQAGDDEVLVARGHHLRTRHQVEKAIARVTDPAVVRFAVEEVLLSPSWAATDRALRDGVALLRQLTEREATSGAARTAMRNVTLRLAGRVKEARAQATRHIPLAATAHDVLALRLAVLRLHDTLSRIAAALEEGGLDAGIIAGERAAGPRRRRLQAAPGTPRGPGARPGRRGARRRAPARMVQLARVEEVLGIGRPRTASTGDKARGGEGMGRGGDRREKASARGARGPATVHA